MNCPSLERLRSFRRQQLPEEERQRVEEHLAGCRSCRRSLVDDLRREEASGPAEVPAEILTRVRGLVDEPPKRDRPASEPSTVRKPSPVRASPRAWLPLAAAMIALVGAWWLSPRPATDPVLRDIAPVSNRLAPLEPAPEAEVGARVRFRWTKVPEASLYRLVILGDDGGRILQRETVEAEIEVDIGNAIGEAADAYWMVEAQLPGGGRLHTDPRPIRLRNPIGPSP